MISSTIQNDTGTLAPNFSVASFVFSVLQNLNLNYLEFHDASSCTVYCEEKSLSYLPFIQDSIQGRVFFVVVLLSQ